MKRPNVEIRQSSDVGLSAAASRLIAGASDEFDIARRSPEFLRTKIESGQAVFAQDDGNLVGFGYYSDWERGRFVSHSGLVVTPEYRGQGLGRRLKMALLEASQQEFPEAVLMSLTTSPEVKAMNLRLGFEMVPIEEVTTDPEFWAGCKHCCSYAETRAQGLKCCCEAMVLRP